MFLETSLTRLSQALVARIAFHGSSNKPERNIVSATKRNNCSDAISTWVDIRQFNEFCGHTTIAQGNKLKMLFLFVKIRSDKALSCGH